MINSKKTWQNRLLSSTTWITELSDRELLDLMKLDLPEKRR